MRIPQSEPRSYERVQEHYRIEKELAARLRSASQSERQRLYTAVYDELFQRVPDHPQLTMKVDERSRRTEVSQRLNLVRPYLKPETIYLEVGPGDCAFALAVARRVRKVYAIDVSKEILGGVMQHGNFELAMSDGCSVPVPEGSVDLAYSDQLMEHLHPDDARTQLENIYQALKPGGTYLCITPNRLSGPHDVSRYFDEVATGFHLREYTVQELTELFRSAGFRKFKILIGGGGVHLPLAPALVHVVEKALTLLPKTFGRKLARGLPLRLVLGAKVVAVK
jgi:SAM-dependent methyltransferase